MAVCQLLNPEEASNGHEYFLEAIESETYELTLVNPITHELNVNVLEVVLHNPSDRPLCIPALWPLVHASRIDLDTVTKPIISVMTHPPKKASPSINDFDLTRTSLAQQQKKEIRQKGLIPKYIGPRKTANQIDEIPSAALRKVSRRQPKTNAIITTNNSKQIDIFQLSSKKTINSFRPGLTSHLLLTLLVSMSLFSFDRSINLLDPFINCAKVKPADVYKNCTVPKSGEKL
eukprot:TCONS_00065784-protein